MKKGQAVMEFLLTYGWAIIVVLAAVAALTYFGVISPERFRPHEYSENYTTYTHTTYTQPDIGRQKVFCELQGMTYENGDWKYDMFFCTKPNRDKIAYNIKELERITLART